MRRWVAGLCTAIAPLIACAELVIGGGVFEDQPALTVRTNFTGIPNVTVRLYRDGSNSPMATAKTSAGGMYVFDGLSAGDYWVAVDSKSIGTTPAAWAEQTFGPAGALCAGPAGLVRPIWFEGPCFAGRTVAGSDDPSTLATSEHVAKIMLREDSATAVDFAFSFDAVTSTADGERIQGSLRQFLVNANALAGPNRMRFVPVERAPERRDPTMGVPTRWWTIHVTTPLPHLTDADTLLDGTAYHFVSPASVADVHPGRHGEAPTVKPDERAISLLEKPELEVTLTGAEGLVCDARCGVRGVALLGAPTAVVMRADARLEHLLIGASPDAAPAATFGSVGLQIESGTTAARHLLVTAQTRAGVIVGQGAKLDGEALEVSRCGDPASGGAIVLLSNGSSVRSSTIASNGGAGILIGSPDGSAPANANIVDGCTISGNQAGVIFGPGSSRNVVTRSDIMWNRLGGVTNAPAQTATLAPRENRVSANRFNENGLRPIVLDLGTPDPNALAERGSGTCGRLRGAANDGISPPELTSVTVMQEGSAGRVMLRGRACPGHIVELYQSYVTAGVREEAQAEVPQIRNESTDERETITSDQRVLALPSIGEFNYLGAASTAADGTFEAVFPLPTLARMTRRSVTADEEQNNIWAREVLPGAEPSDRAFSALAIDPAGNTSEMSVRRQVD
jgi:hypothetical protein